MSTINVKLTDQFTITNTPQEPSQNPVNLRVAAAAAHRLEPDEVAAPSALTLSDFYRFEPQQDAPLVVVNSYPIFLPARNGRRKFSYTPSSRVPQERAIKISNPKKTQGYWISKGFTANEIYKWQISKAASKFATENEHFDPMIQENQHQVKSYLQSIGFPSDVLAVVRVLIKIAELKSQS